MGIKNRIGTILACTQTHTNEKTQERKLEHVIYLVELFIKFSKLSTFTHDFLPHEKWGLNRCIISLVEKFLPKADQGLVQ